MRVRSRLLGAALVLGVPLAWQEHNMISVVATIAWLACAAVLAKKITAGFLAAYFWATDFVVIAALLLTGQCGLLLASALLAAAAHLSIVICEKAPFQWTAIPVVSGWLLIAISLIRQSAEVQLAVAGGCLLLISAFSTAWLVHRAQKQNAENTNAAMRELIDFTGCSPDRVWHLWSVSDGELAKNWQLAALDESDRERMAQWYRDNSELYMFAISAYNLEYKRIRSNLRVLKFARGACMDYGAGNGELILELARRGHAATYYDVEGRTMKFAQSRAQHEGLSVEFLHSKERLAAAAQKSGFDTVFSFDVLEHLPDLPAELDFLSSLLNPRGVFVFDVPAGSTKSHPMHLNHNLDVRTHLLAKGMEEKRRLVQRLPFKKEEKYVFQAPANAVKTSPYSVKVS
jgi:2-polyprenyl-3-methyl-5-hydroxy-6-metoxy-1,4-benzoquinol methylase